MTPGRVDGPIAILAGGAGGLAVARVLEQLMPHEDVVVLADQAYAPYAARSPGVVVDRVTRLVDDLVADGAKLVVLASAAATGDALAAVRARLPADVPVLGFDGALTHAAARASGRSLLAIVGEGCVRGLPHAQSVRRLRGADSVATVVWPGLMEAVERGGAGLAAVVERGLEQLARTEGVLVLACAHAAAAAAHVAAAAGERPVVDGAAVAGERVRLTLSRNGLLAHRRRAGRRVVMTTWPDRASGLAAGAGRRR